MEHYSSPWLHPISSLQPLARGMHARAYAYAYDRMTWVGLGGVGWGGVWGGWVGGWVGGCLGVGCLCVWAGVRVWVSLVAQGPAVEQVEVCHWRLREDGVLPNVKPSDAPPRKRSTETPPSASARP